MSSPTSTSPVIALAGSPNAGKSVLFNALTGLHQKVANYPGVTVESKTGITKPWNGKVFKVIDLPGIYSLDPISIDEQVAIEVLLGKWQSTEYSRPDVIVAVIDASNLERTLGLVLELRQLKLPIVVALNMMDLAHRRCLKINVQRLQQELKMPVVPLIATRGDGIPALLTQVEMSLKNEPTPIPQRLDVPTTADISNRFHEVDAILAKVIESPSNKDILSWKIDNIVLHPVWGVAILSVVLMAMFQSVFTWATPAADAIDSGIAFTNEWLKLNLPVSPLTDLLTDGIISGVGSVVVFLPQIVLLFFFINLLEASGYMTRAAFILDRMMHFCGLQGRSFVPLLSSFACAIPGIMATRTIRSERDRLVTLMVAPLITCSARLPVYTLLISAFVPAATVYGIFDLRALTMFGLFLLSVISAFAVALVSKFFGGKRSLSPFLLEMPSYRMPQLKYIATSILFRVKAFLQRAGTIILASSIAIWILCKYPAPPVDASDSAITYSFAGRIGHALEPLVAPIGFDWRIATGLIPGMAAREVMVSSLATVFAIEANDEEAQMRSLEDRVKLVWTPATGFALIAWYVYAPQCLSTIATVRRETGRWKWALIMTAYMFAFAWVAAWVTFRIFSVAS